MSDETADPGYEVANGRRWSLWNKLPHLVFHQYATWNSEALGRAAHFVFKIEGGQPEFAGTKYIYLGMEHTLMVGKMAQAMGWVSPEDHQKALDRIRELEESRPPWGEGWVP